MAVLELRNYSLSASAGQHHRVTTHDRQYITFHCSHPPPLISRSSRELGQVFSQYKAHPLSSWPWGTQWVRLRTWCPGTLRRKGISFDWGSRVSPLHSWLPRLWIQPATDWFNQWVSQICERGAVDVKGQLCYIILHKELEHPWILISVGILEPIPPPVLEGWLY